jgi:hypothetical protein
MKAIKFLLLFLLQTIVLYAQKPREVSHLEKFNLKPIESIIDKQSGKCH